MLGTREEGNNGGEIWDGVGVEGPFFMPIGNFTIALKFSFDWVSNIGSCGVGCGVGRDFGLGKFGCAVLPRFLGLVIIIIATSPRQSQVV